jgi:hypothetical protein
MFTKTNRNDPLVESIKNVMEQNDLLRRVETAVNEHFGVVSKKALPHEYHAEYDAIFEETKKCAMAEEESDKDKKVATPEHHRAEAIRIHKQIKMSGKLPHLVAKKKEHEEAYRKMTGNKIKYPDDLNESKIDEGVPIKQKYKEHAAKASKLYKDADLDMILSGRPSFWHPSQKTHLSDSSNEKTKAANKEQEKAKKYKNIAKKFPLAQVSEDLNEAKDEGSTPKTAKEKALAKLHGDPNKITHGDVLKGRGVVEEEKATEAQKEKVAKVMHKWKQGKEHIGKSEKTVPVTKKGQKQAVAIALSQAGLSKKQKMDEQTSIDSIVEEIRNNLEEQLVAVYESGDESAFADFIGSLTEEQLDILGLNEAEVTTRKKDGTVVNVVTGKPAYTPPAAQSQPKATNKAPDVATSTKAAMASAAGNPMVRQVAGKSVSSNAPAGVTPQSLFASPKTQVTSRSNASSGTVQKMATGGGERLGANSGAGVGKPVARGQAAISPQANKAGVTPTQRTASPRPGVSAPKVAAQKPGMARPGTTPVAKRVPGAIATATQKRIGYQTKAANVSPGQMMSMREETEAPKPIKESFEQFLRNKFLKG